MQPFGQDTVSLPVLSGNQRFHRLPDGRPVSGQRLPDQFHQYICLHFALSVAVTADLFRHVAGVIGCRRCAFCFVSRHQPSQFRCQYLPTERPDGMLAQESLPFFRCAVIETLPEILHPYLGLVTGHDGLLLIVMDGLRCGFRVFNLHGFLQFGFIPCITLGS
ncbi:hypothetical protein [uncultured Cardiobacterium sp.]|uniref:hypothetical protein n=1 Tax=uncultured Cardiobacterium sp. TaxID=417619 RepID=UPI0026388633|nr:hypothetical protein [uncultured Cardiobacterium sp.]